MTSPVAEEAVVVPQPQQHVQLQPAEAAGGVAVAGGKVQPVVFLDRLM